MLRHSVWARWVMLDCSTCEVGEAIEHGCCVAVWHVHSSV